MRTPEIEPISTKRNNYVFSSYKPRYVISIKSCFGNCYHIFKILIILTVQCILYYLASSKQVCSQMSATYVLYIQALHISDTTERIFYKKFGIGVNIVSCCFYWSNMARTLLHDAHIELMGFLRNKARYRRKWYMK
jgi:hypothetical protein